MCIKILELCTTGASLSLSVSSINKAVYLKKCHGLQCSDFLSSFSFLSNFKD